MKNKLVAFQGDYLPVEDRREYEYLLQIRAADGVEDTQLTVSIATHHGIEIFEQQTPFEHSFSAAFYYIFYEGTPSRTRLVAELYGNEFGEFRKIAGTGGVRGKMIRDPIQSIHSAGGF